MHGGNAWSYNQPVTELGQKSTFFLLYRSSLNPYHVSISYWPSALGQTTRLSFLICEIEILTHTL